MWRFVRDHSLSLVTLGAFLVIWLGGQAWAGHRTYNEEQRAHGEPTVGMAEYVTRSEFGEATFESWESEFLRWASTSCSPPGSCSGDQPSPAHPTATRPSTRPPHHRADPDAPWPVLRGGLALRIYEHSQNNALLGLLGLLVLAFLGHLVTGAQAFSAEQAAHGEPGVSALGYLFRAQFWFESLQNWQSEFLAVGTLVVLSVFLRQRGSPESKPVRAPHHQTGSE